MRVCVRGGWRWVLAGAVGLAVLLFGGELSATWYPGTFTILQPHVLPIIRCLEFAIAYFAGCALSERGIMPGAPREGSRIGAAAWTAIEAVSAMLVFACMIAFNGVWLLSMFVLLFVGAVVLVALERGLVTRAVLSSRPLAAVARIELPFFMSHQVIWNIVQPLTMSWLPNRVVVAATFALSVAFSVCWNAAARRLPVLSGRRRIAGEGR